MMDFDNALQLMGEGSFVGDIENIPIENALGRVLAESVTTPFDFPPFSKAAMDGYALSSRDPSERYRIVESIAAGSPPTKAIDVGLCSKIMTGAMMPEGADKVIRVEYTEVEGDNMTPIREESGFNVIVQGENAKMGDEVLDPRVLRPQDIGVLATLGKREIGVVAPPRVGIINTGSELKEPGETLSGGEIFNSNGYQLCAQVAAINCPYRFYGIVEDKRDGLLKVIKAALEECDIILLSGGVSMGDYDLVPDLLKEAGVEIIFHKMAIKPGKPTLYGRREDRDVIGLPGNPVSTFVIFEVMVKSLIFSRMGLNYSPLIYRGILKDEIKRRDTSRLEFRPVRIDSEGIHGVTYRGSSHIHALGEANGLLRIEVGKATLPVGTEVDVRQI